MPDYVDGALVARVLAIDPGYEKSAFVLFDGQRVIEHGIVENAELLDRLTQRLFGLPKYITVIEQIESFGMAVGRETFETVFWAGRFAQAADGFDRVTRKTVKLHLCHSHRAKDGNVRQALIDRFGGTAAMGSKKAPGPIYGVTSHKLAALAVAVTWWDARISVEEA